MKKRRTATYNKQIKENQTNYLSWKHPGGKLRELGAKFLSNEELLSILISTGTRGRSALEIAHDILKHHGSFEALTHLPLADLLNIKGLGDVKIIRIAAALEIGRRAAEEIINRHAKKI